MANRPSSWFRIIVGTCLLSSAIVVPAAIAPTAAHAAIDCYAITDTPPPLTTVAACAPNSYSIRAVAFALYQRGDQYQNDGCRFGIMSPQPPCHSPWHYDCSGLAWAASHYAGHDIGGSARTTTSIATDHTMLWEPLSNALPGDLIFFMTGDPGSIFGLGHMGIVYGGGWMIDATSRSSKGHQVVLEKYAGNGRDPGLSPTWPSAEYYPTGG